MQKVLQGDLGKQAEQEATGDGLLFSIVNQRWTLVLLQILRSGPVRFNFIVRASSINPNTLVERLRDLEHAGIVERRVVSDTPMRVEYLLSEAGNELGEIAQKIMDWATSHALDQK